MRALSGFGVLGVLLVGLMATACSGAGAQADAQPQSDQIVLPPSHREALSPNGLFRLVLVTVDQWKTPIVTAAFSEVGAGASRWSRSLPHHLGPRIVVVANDGHVLLVDEWINVRSRFALMLLGVDGQAIATYDFDAVVAAAGVALSDVAAHAKNGTWLSSSPELTSDGRGAIVSVGGRALLIALVDGRLTLLR